MDESKTSETELDLESVPECGPRDFPYRDGTQPLYSCKVPANKHYIYLQACGGSGGTATGDESGKPGLARVITGLVPVIPGQILDIYVGGGDFRGWQARPGYRPGGDGGTSDQRNSSNGGGGGGSSAVVIRSTGEVLIHAGGGGGCGGRGGLSGQMRGGNGGASGLNPGDGTEGQGDSMGRGGRGGKGGDPKRTDRGGPGGSGGGLGAGGGGGGGGGGRYCGGGGGLGTSSNGGGGGGGGSSYIVAGAIGVVEYERKERGSGYVEFYEKSVESTIASSAFKDVFLRMDASGLTRERPGGIVNCQYKAGKYEHFYVRPQPNGTVTIESEQFPDVHLRMDGTGLSRDNPFGGVVNCQYITDPPDPLTFFNIVANPEGLFSIESVAFPGVYLGMDGTGVDKFLPNGGGKVYSRYGASSWEVFRMLAP